MKKRFNEVLKEWREKKGNIIPLLQQTQEIFGFLPQEQMVEIARTTGKSPAQIYGVATFYAQFRFQPQGKHIIKICHGTACHVIGADEIDVALKMELGVEPGETTEDGFFTLERVSCLGCCSLAPVVMIDSEIHGRLNWSKLLKTIRKIADEEKD
jgi:NADH-quinone oxidoreductase subunit E